MAQGAKRKGRGRPAPARKRKQRRTAGQSAYEKRIADYLRRHPGATRQEARGHKPKESQTRRSRERDRVRQFAEDQAYRGEAQGSRDPDEIEAAIWEQIRIFGYGRYFGQLEKRNRALHDEYLAQGGDHSIGIDMDAESDVWSLPAVELFYH